jgi:short-chain fatty acids transporter
VLKRTTELFVRLVERWMPDPYLLCILLTYLTAALARVCTATPVQDILSMWYDGLWDILSFATQTTLVLLTGYTLAHAPRVRNGLQRVAGLASTPQAAVVGVFLATAVSSWFNWGFGLVTGALVACEVARRVRIDFPFLVAVAYSGFVVWASGLSSTIALVTASHGNKMNIVEQQTGNAISLRDTLFTPFNLLPTLFLLVAMPLVFRRLIPDSPRQVSPPVEEDTAADEPDTPAGRLERSRLITVLLVGLGLAALGVRIANHSFVLDLSSIVFIFMLLGLLAHETPIRFVRAFLASARLSGPLLLQYPLYGGIMGIMTKSHLAEAISTLFVSLASAHTLPFFSFVASCVISLFVPSGGGHWVVQAPIMVPAAIKLGANQAAVAMGVAFGEQVANMVQPFWALPILAIAGLGIRDIMGYCVVTLAMAFSAYGLALLIFG